MENLQFIFLQSTTDLVNQFMPFILILVIMYFFFIRPQAQKQKKQQAFVNNLEKGDEVVTSSGMLGKITKIEDNIVTLEVGQKSYIRMTKGAISRELTEELYKEKA